MLKVLRKKKRSWMIFLILGPIIMVFVLWGVGNFKLDKATVAAGVNGKPITATTYVRAYQQQINYYRNILKDQFNDEFLERMNLKQNTIQMLINTELQLQEAKKQGITVSTDDIQKKIASIQVFQKGDVFDKGQYLQVLKANHLLPGDYEKGVKDSLIIDKVQKKITDTINITDKEIEDTFAGENKKINLQYIAVDGAMFEKDAVAADGEAQAYFEKNKASFKLPTMIKAAYISIPFKDLLQKAKISEAEIKEYYEKNINEFQIRPASGASDMKKAKEEARLMPFKEAKDIIIKKLTETGAKKLALDTASEIQKAVISEKREMKDEATKKKLKLVETGPFSERDMKIELVRNAELKKAAFSLKAGEISNAVETESSVYIIKILDKKEEHIPGYEEAAASVKNALIKGKAMEKAKEAADAILKRLKQGEGFQKLASKLVPAGFKQGDGYTTGESGFFTKVEGYIANMGLSVGDKPDMFSLTKEKPYYSQTIPHGNKFYIFGLKDIKEADKAEFEAKKAQIKDRLLKEKQQDSLNKWLNDLKSKAKIEINKEAL
ncbi:MAG TPA: peptidylprolyl isomerase [Thermodesulfobacteriota bacterium]|nr:peptidylprolyl isomerase [Thermodesulfobacteriota bacterium]